MSSLQTDHQELQLSASITDALAEFSQRRIRLLTLRAIAAGLIGLIATMTIVAIVDYLLLLPNSARWLLSLVAYGVTIGMMLRFGWRRSDRNDMQRIARQFESADPNLHEQLLSTVELSDPESTNGSLRFRQWLQDRTSRRLASVEIGQLLSVDLIRPWLLTAAIVLITTGLLLVIPSVQFGRRIARAMLPAMAIERASLTKISITEPSPPGGPVAAGDAIGIVATIDRPGNDQPRLEWRTDDGAYDIRPMTSRSGSDAYSVILAVGEVPVEYRIMAGDGVTLWHRLTPIPRPTVQSFTKRYIFPNYAEMADEIVEQDHGDLKAVRGTVANVTVRFSEPCSAASIQFVGRVNKLAMMPSNETGKLFSVEIPIVQPNRYQVIAESKHSGLQNPQTHPASVIPIDDSPPLIRWDEHIEREQIVSMIDVITLNAQVQDEFPIDSLTQEYQINDGPTVERKLAVPETGMVIDIGWEWDLLDEESKFATGDVVRTQLVAIDRRGQRGESAKLELLLADKGFAPHRYARTDQLYEAASAVVQWTQLAAEQMKRAGKLERQDLEFANSLPPSAEIDRLLVALLATANNPAEAERLELTARALQDIDRRINAWFAERTLALDDDGTDLTARRESILKQLIKKAHRLSSDAKQVEAYMRDQLSDVLTIGLIDDATTLMNSLHQFLQSKMPADRQTRYLRVADGRLAEIDETFAKYKHALSPPLNKQREGWSVFRQQQHERLTRAIEQPESPQQQREVIDRLAYDLESGISDRSIFSRQVSLGLTNGLRTVQRQITPIDESVRQLLLTRSSIGQVKQELLEVEDSNQVVKLNRDSDFFNRRFDANRQSILLRLYEARDRHNDHPYVDLPFIADLGLMRRAVERVTGTDFTDQDGERGRDLATDEALHELADAFQILRSGHDLLLWQSELRSLIGSETDIPTGAAFRFANPQRFEDYTAGIAWPVEQLNQSSIDPSSLRRTIHVSAAEQIQRVNRLLGERRFERDQLASARRPLRVIETELNEYLDQLRPFMRTARAILRSYAIPLHQQARLAAEKVLSAIEAIESDNGSHEELTKKQAEADAATKQTMESLVDLANTLSTADHESRELARDADSALAQIGKQRDRVNDAMKTDASPADVAEELEGLRERLDRTADHFELAENGKDISDSRQKMREAEQNLDIQQELNERAERAKAMAEAAERNAVELRKQLEKEAEKNELMREAMSEIAKKTARAAMESLKQSAQDERSLNLRLERSDPELAERKHRLTDRVRALARELSSLDQILGSAISEAAKQTPLPDQLDELQQARQSIGDAAQSSEDLLGDDDLRTSIIETASTMGSQVRSAIESIKAIQEAAGAAESERIELTDAQKKTVQRNAERQMRQVRDQQVRASNEQKRNWTKAKQNADRRVQQANQQVRSNENVKHQLEDNTDDDPEAIKNQIAQIQQRIDQAVRAENAALDSVAEAKQQMILAGQKTDELRKEAIEPFESEIPSAGAINPLADKAADQLSQILEDLDAIADEGNAAATGRVPEYATNYLKTEQQHIRQEVDDIGDELRRAALNEQRLGRKESAQNIADAATRIKKVASSSAAEAINELERAAEDAKAASAAVERIAETEQQITREAIQLAKLLGESPEQPTDQRSEPSESQDQRAEQLARTLDELDQANQQNGQSESEQSAGEASPTLQQAMDDSARAAARERRQQISPGESQGQKPTDSMESASAGNNPFSGTPGGENSDEGTISIKEMDRIGADWGQLRVRRPGDSSDLRRTRVPDRYRRQIEAYFRAIAQRSSGGER